MADAKKCDICGNYYDAPEIGRYRLDYEEYFNAIRLHRAKKDDTEREEPWFHFDACDKCCQDIMDYILTKKAENTVAE